MALMYIHMYSLTVLLKQMSFVKQFLILIVDSVLDVMVLTLACMVNHLRSMTPQNS